MADLSTEQAWDLIKKRKTFLDSRPIKLPSGGKHHRLLMGDSVRERFKLSMIRAPSGRSKLTFHKMDSANTPLLRLDLGDHVPTHVNPDKTSVRGPHLHIYREGYGDAWAVPLTSHHEFSGVCDVGGALNELCEFCNIANPPPVQLAM